MCTAGRMTGRRVLVIGAGQESYGLPAEDVSLGNGRAACLRMAQEGAVVACADLHLDRAEETAALITAAGGQAHAFAQLGNGEGAIMLQGFQKCKVDSIEHIHSFLFIFVRLFIPPI